MNNLSFYDSNKLIKQTKEYQTPIRNNYNRNLYSPTITKNHQKYIFDSKTQTIPQIYKEPSMNYLRKLH